MWNKKGRYSSYHGPEFYEIKSKSKDKINVFFDVLIKYLGDQGNILYKLIEFCKSY